MRILTVPHFRFAYAYLRQNLSMALSCAASPFLCLDGVPRFLDLFSDSLKRVKCGHRILKDHGYFLSADG